ncbi:protein of unknown function [Candidatus Nitrospira inopinata]|uniref:Uncharacterized protein n=1 Tax=Candidatus Nitrospira inopinata TaxID=1715989 RepID=A0A0S4KWD2_9BACT|nr:protein of unknown function [Candidatus Nitrospira inopinata]
MLQWGRGVSAAEMGTGAGRRDGMRRRLQWGRGVSAAEMNCANGTTINLTALQWGRGVSAAEIAYVVPPSVLHVLGFNGAAAFQPRKSAAAAKTKSWGTMLQWGRGVSAAEICRRREDQVLGDDASMGPRRFSRGNYTRVIAKKTGDCGFNGAAAFQPRK